MSQNLSDLSGLTDLVGRGWDTGDASVTGYCLDVVWGTAPSVFGQFSFFVLSSRA
jgi:hypothetical protein